MVWFSLKIPLGFLGVGFDCEVDCEIVLSLLSGSGLLCLQW